MVMNLKKDGKVIARVDKLSGTGSVRFKMNGSKIARVETGSSSSRGGDVVGKEDPFIHLMSKDDNDTAEAARERLARRLESSLAELVSYFKTEVLMGSSIIGGNNNGSHNKNQNKDEGGDNS